MKPLSTLLLLAPLLCLSCSSAPDPGDTRLASWTQYRAAHMELVHCLKTPSPEAPWSPMKGTLEALGALASQLDPHSYFLSPEAYRRFYEDHLGAYGGIGLRVADFPQGVTVFSVVPQSPAARAGIRSGDLLKSIEGLQVETIPFRHLADRMRGEPGSTVTLGFGRNGHPGLLRLSLIREALDQKSLTGSCAMPQAPKVLYLKLSTFSSRSAGEIQAALRQAPEPLGAILDLRGNSGGSLQASLEICNLFLPLRSEVVRIQSRHGEETLVCSHEPAFPELPLALLVDRESASASEIVAAALQAHNRATLWGERTWGKALVQTVWPISGACGLGLTTGHYLSPGGRELQRPYPVLDAYLHFFPEGYGEDRSGPGGVLPDHLLSAPPLPTWTHTLRRKGTLFHRLLPRLEAGKASCPQGPTLRKLLKGELPSALAPQDQALLDALARHEWHSMQHQEAPATQALLEGDPVAGRAAAYLVKSARQTPPEDKETRP